MGIEIAAAPAPGLGASALPPFGNWASLAHDLRRPLSAIALGLEWLLESPTEDDAPRSSAVLDVVRRNIRLMDEIIGTDGRREDVEEPSVTPVDLLAVVADVAELHQPILRVRGQRLGIVSHLGDDTAVGGMSRVELKRVVLNLLDNAAKFAPDGDDLRIELRRRGGSVRISVIDHGPGIAPTDRRLVFTPGYRGEASAGVPGLGFGLAYLARAVRSAGGSFGIHRRGGETAVWFTVATEARSADAVSG